MSQLFAVRTATALPQSFAADGISFYDSDSQTSTWASGTPLLALTCSNAPNGSAGCNAYGSYCSGYGGKGIDICD